MPSALAPLPSAPDEKSNWEILSLLRFFLAFVVAVSHLAAFQPRLGPLSLIARLGSFEAILGFLLISGYSIGHSIQKAPKGFFLRRVLRIYPVYLVAMIMTYLIQPEAVSGSFVWTILLNLLFLGQILIAACYVGVAWSLALEVWLYALAPLLRRLKERALELLIGLSFLCYAFYTCGCSLFHWPYYAGTLYGINLPCLAFIWIAGFYLAVTVREKRRPLKIIGALFLGHLILTLVIATFHHVKHHELRESFSGDGIDFICHGFLLALLVATFFGILHHRFHVTLFQRRICRFLGDISYPLYLIHYPIFAGMVLYTRNPTLLLLTALLASTAIYFGCDFYSRRRKLA